ncbi:MAG TPA: VOC family protein [Gemmatimonadales bacterium]|nr:VOC family protein [Gemmatimonadales bacterium]
MTTSSRGTAIGIAPKGYRLPPESHPGAVRLQVSDVDASLQYYRHELGFRLLDRKGSVVMLGAQQGDDVLIELHGKPGVRPVPKRGLLGLYHFAILLPDRKSLGAFLTHMSSLGHRLGMSDHHVSEALYTSDPDGLGIEIYADRARDEWKVDPNGQVFMVTETLDVNGLLEATGDTPWRGMPAGTRIGHVHLHVGDLALADAYYHNGLGFDRIVWGYPGALFLSAGGYHHHVGTNTWAAAQPAANEQDAQLLEWELKVPAATDVEQAAASLEQGGYEVAREAGSAISRDPWGTAVRIVPA